VKTQLSSSRGFSLVEVTIALGIAGVSLIAIFGLLPIGAQTNRNSTSQTAAVNILAAITADLRATPNSISPTGQYHLTLGTPQTLYFDDVGAFASAPTGTSKYRVDVSYPATTGRSRAATYVKLVVIWPAQASAATAAGSAELFAAFDRH
jgi:uncharacterized protein (TIGR02598 family)